MADNNNQQSPPTVLPEQKPPKIIVVRVPGIQGPPGGEENTTNYQLIYELARG